MKSIEINGKTYPLYIGFDFIRELDRKYTHDSVGVQFGWGVGKILVALSQFSALAIADFILAATNTLDEAPTEKDIEDQFAKWDIGQIVGLCENFIDLLAKNSLTRTQVAEIGLTLSAEEVTKSED